MMLIMPSCIVRGGSPVKSPVVKRSIVVAGHKTSVSLEEAFWNGMKEISGLRNMTLSELVGEIDSNRQQGNLSSAIRLFVLDYFKSRAGSAGGEPKRAADSLNPHSGQAALS
jgi:predicted DNA-binding ribbon-helix-helix protein